MARIAAHHDLIGPARDAHLGVARQGIPQADGFIDGAAGLVENRHVQIGAQLDLAGIGGQLAGQHLDERGLAGAVRADKGHPVAAQHAQVKWLQDHPLAKGFRDALGVDHPLARLLATVQLHRRRALPADLPRALVTQRGQRADAALVALAACRNALDCPFRLGLDLAVQLVAGLVLGGPQGLAPILEMFKAAILPAHLATVDPQRGPGQGTQKGAVVRDQHEGRAGAGKLFFQPADGLDIQMVRRLVQQHQLGRLGQQAGQCGAATLAPRGGRHRPVGIEFQPLGRHLDPVALGLVQSGAGEIAQGGIGR